MLNNYTYPSALEIRQAKVKPGDGPKSDPHKVANDTFFDLENRCRSLRIAHMKEWKERVHPKNESDRNLFTAVRVAESELLSKRIYSSLNKDNVTMGEDYVVSTFGLAVGDKWLQEYNMFEKSMERFRSKWLFNRKNEIFADAMKEQALYLFHNVSEEVKKSNPDFQSYSGLFCEKADLEIKNTDLKAKIRDLEEKVFLHEQTLGLRLFEGEVATNNGLGTNEEGREATVNNALVVRTSTELVLKTPEKEGASAVAVSAEKETSVNKKTGGVIVPVLSANRVKSYSDDDDEGVDNDYAKKRKRV